MKQIELLIDDFLNKRISEEELKHIDNLLATDSSAFSMIKDAYSYIQAIKSHSRDKLKTVLDSIHQEVKTELEQEALLDQIDISELSELEISFKKQVRELEDVLRSSEEAASEKKRITIADSLFIETVTDHYIYNFLEAPSIDLHIEVKNYKNEIVYSKTIGQRTSAFRVSLDEFTTAHPGTYIYTISPEDWKLSESYLPAKGILSVSQ